MRRRPANEDRGPERFVAGVVLRMVHSDPSVELVVQAHFAVGHVFVAGELDAVHAQVGLHDVAAARRQGEHLGQGYKSPPVQRPGFDLGQLPHRGAPVKDGRAQALVHGQR